LKFKYLIVCFLLINLYGFEGIKFYQNGEYKKAKKSFSKYAKEKNSIVAEVFLAKIYYREGKYQKAKKLINKLLKNDSVPVDVKEELKEYLVLINGKVTYKTSVSAGILYDSNVNWDKIKKSSFAHTEELNARVSYIQNNFKTSAYAKLENREYFDYSQNNYVYVNTNAYLTYYSFINTRFKIGYNAKTTKSNHLYTNELYFFKRFNNYKTGIFAWRDYYRNGDLSSKNSGGGIRTIFWKNNFKTKLSLMSYYNNYKNNNLDNRNYKIDIKNSLYFSNYYLFINYYYDLSKFNHFINHIHYLHGSFNGKITKSIDYSIGMKEYYYFIHSFDYEIRKYEIYTKLIYNF
jgi:hypothetical protein